MKIGIVFPQTEIGDDTGAIRDFAVAVEELGYSHMLAYDHVIGAEHAGREPRLTGPYTQETPFHEPFLLFAYMAAITTTLEFATGVIILPQRQTALVAKQAADLDLLSGQRLRLGIGTGWNWVEYDVLGEDFHNRGRRQAEQVEVLRKLWTEELVTYKGRWHDLDRVNILHRPKRSIPIWFGGAVEAVYKRAGAIGDGFMPGFAPDAEGKATLERIKGYVAEAGRDPAAFGIEGRTTYSAGPEAWRTQAADWQGLGADFISVVTMNAGLKSPADHIKAATQYMEALKGL